MSTQAISGIGLAGKARGLRELIEERAAQAEANRTASPLVVAVFHEAKLARALTPRDLGGAEVDVATAFEIIETVSMADGASGWTLMAGMTTLAIAGAYLGDAAVKEIFAEDRAFTAGQIAPLGTCTAVEDGYHVEGRFGFCSGADSATFIFGGFRQQHDGEQVRLPSGLPRIVAAIVPKERVEFLGNWDTIGLRGTGSYDYRIPPQAVPESFTFSFFESEPLRGGPLYRIGPNGLTCIAHSAFALGVARRVLDEIAALAPLKRRAGRRTLADDDLFQNDYARAEAALYAARCGALDVLRELEDAAHRDAVDQSLRARARLATTYACNIATEVATTAYRYAGSAGLRNGSALQRGVRDLLAAEQHVFTDQLTYTDAAKVLLDRAPDTLYL